MTENKQNQNYIPVSGGICTGKNGTREISGVIVSGFADMVRLDCRSKNRGIVLNGGFSLDRGAALALADGIYEYLSGSDVPD